MRLQIEDAQRKASADSVAAVSPEPEFPSAPPFPFALRLSMRCPVAVTQDAPSHSGSRRLVRGGKAIPSRDLSPSAPEALAFSSIHPVSPEPCLQERRRVILRLRRRPEIPCLRPKPLRLSCPHRDDRTVALLQ